MSNSESDLGVETMTIVRTGLAIMLLTAMSLSSVSQEAEPEETTPPAEPPPAEPPPAESAPPPDTRPLDEIFIPSQEIAADGEIVFPVNI